MNFLKALMRDPKIKRVRAKMRKADSERAAISREFERTKKIVAAKIKRKNKKSTKSHTKRRRRY